MTPAVRFSNSLNKVASTPTLLSLKPWPIGLWVSLPPSSSATSFSASHQISAAKSWPFNPCHWPKRRHSQGFRKTSSLMLDASLILDHLPCLPYLLHHLPWPPYLLHLYPLRLLFSLCCLPHPRQPTNALPRPRWRLVSSADSIITVMSATVQTTVVAPNFFSSSPLRMMTTLLTHLHHPLPYLAPQTSPQPHTQPTRLIRPTCLSHPSRRGFDLGSRCRRPH